LRSGKINHHQAGSSSGTIMPSKQAEEDQDKTAEQDQPRQKLSVYSPGRVTTATVTNWIWFRAGFHGCHVQNDKVCYSLVFRMLRTNVDYKVVAEFMTQYEDQQSISEALSILKAWNPVWKPNHFMADFSTVKIGDFEEQFGEATA